MLDRVLAAGLATAGLLPIVAAAQDRRAISTEKASVPRMSAGIVAFVNVGVVPMDTERVLLNHTVLIKGGRIAALGPANTVQAPVGAVRIDGRGKYLIPGLADMHAHLNAPEQSIYGKDDSTRAENRLLHLWLANGVTTIRNLDFALPAWGERALRLRDRAAAGDLLSPRIYTAGAWTGKRGFESFLEVAPEQVAALLAAYKSAGYDFIKIHEEGGKPLFDSLVAAARREGLPIVGHTPKAEAVKMGHGFAERRRDWALAAPMKSTEHLYDYPWTDTTHAAIQAVAEAAKRAGIWTCPTWMIHQKLENPPESRTAYARRLIQALQAAGAGLLLGTDNLYSKAMLTVHDELRALVEEAGLTPYQALLTGTKNVAVYFGTLEETGTVTVGKRADLVLLRDNPLTDIRNTAEPVGTMIGGRWVIRAELTPHWEGLQRRDTYARYLGVHGSFSEVAKGIVLTGEQKMARRQLEKRFLAHRNALLDSLASVVDTTVGYERLLRMIARRFGDYRTEMTPEQVMAFDVNARAWIKGSEEQGYRITISGVSPQ